MMSPDKEGNPQKIKKILREGVPDELRRRIKTV
jgi:hypothetical protein